MTLPEHGQHEQYSYPDEQPAKPEGKELGFWLITFDCDIDVDVGALGAPFVFAIYCIALRIATSTLDAASSYFRLITPKICLQISFRLVPPLKS